MFYGASSQCQEFCGDGLDFGLNECEDNNTFNGDGCSSTCKLEDGYKCTGGTRTSPDKCTEIKT